jgi:hypothetical protein
MGPRCVYERYRQYFSQSLHLLAVFVLKGVGKSFPFSLPGLATIVLEKSPSGASFLPARPPITPIQRTLGHIAHTGGLWEMRKSLWIIAVLLLFAAIGAPNARADTMDAYTYTIAFGSTIEWTWTTFPLAPVTGPTTILATALASYSPAETACSVSNPFTSVTLDLGFGLQGAIETTCAIGGAVPSGSWTLAEYSTPGTYPRSCSGGFGTCTLTVVQATATPEPATVGLILLGMGLVFVMRKRMAQGLPPAT